MTLGTPPASSTASRVSASSGCMFELLACSQGRLHAGDAAECRADRHADACGVALAEHVAGHHLAGDKKVRAGAAAEVHGGFVVHLQAEVGEGDAGLER